MRADDRGVLTFGTVLRHDLGCRGHNLLLLRIQLIEQAPLTHVKRSAWLTIVRVSLLPIVQAPAGSSAHHGAAKVDKKVVGCGFPVSVTAAERLLMMDGNDGSVTLQDLQNGLGLCFRLGRRFAVSCTMWREKIQFDLLQ